MWTNGLEYVHENAFLGLWNLQELHLFGGNLVRFEPNTFQPLPNLRFLEVSYNLIEVLDSRWFLNNTLLARIHFNYNLIYAVAPNIVDQPALTNLQLLENICVNDIFVINELTRDQVLYYFYDEK
jgi:Leucine-rich repeat (LRR) protein